MSCPFPGMDPYLEMQPFWGDFVPDFLASMRNALLSELLPRYDVRIEEYMFVMHEDIRLHRVRPDVSITSTPAWKPQTQRHLKIIHLPNEEVVTVIELLSPTNKRSGEDGIDAYLEKRAELVASGVNLVEIDLLRGGDRFRLAITTSMSAGHGASHDAKYLGGRSECPCQPFPSPFDRTTKKPN